MKTYTCSKCGTRTIPKKEYVFNKYVFIVLLLLFVIPGLVYYLLTKNKYIEKCRVCDHDELVDNNSATAKRIRSDRN